MPKILHGSHKILLHGIRPYSDSMFEVDLEWDLSGDTDWGVPDSKGREWLWIYSQDHGDFKVYTNYFPQELEVRSGFTMRCIGRARMLIERGETVNFPIDCVNDVIARG
jgi:hypothetical protein